MTVRTCAVAGCGKPSRPHRRAGLCSMHTTRMERHACLADPRRSAEERILSKFTKGTSSECWAWQGPMSSNGYGNIPLETGRGARATSAHRAVYLILVGEIPAGLDLDHLCRNRRCVNPAHLEPVTRQENIRRAAAFKTECAQGHAYSEENTYYPPSRPTVRVCRECVANIQRRRRANRKAAA